MTLSEISTKVLTKLEEEAGSSDWWTATEIKQWANDLYRETAEELLVCKERDVSQDSVDGTMAYTLPVPTGYERVLALLGVSYDKKVLPPTSVEELDATVYRWRNQDAGTPREYFYDLGEELTGVSFFPKPGADGDELGYDLVLLPDELGDDESPKSPFTSGFLLVNGVLAVALAKAGGGRDLDRSEHYWRQYVSGLASFTKSKHPRKSLQLGSVESVSIKGSLRLGDHYPPYSF